MAETGLPAKDDKVKPVDVLQYDEEVEKGYVPEGYESVEDFLQCMREEYEADLNADDDNRREGLDDKLFAAGEQWDPAVVAHRAGLPCLTINTIPQFTAQLVGDWRQSRNAIKVLPGEDGDVETASIRGDLIRSIEYKSRAERVYDSAFESQVTCGDGAFRVAIEYARDDVFDQELCIRPIDDAFSVVWDRMSVDPTGRDARHCFVEDAIPRKEFERKFKDKKPSELGTTQMRTMRQTGWLDDTSVRVVEYWKMIERDRLLGMFADGSIHVLDADSVDLVETLGPPVKTRISPCLYAQMHLVTGWDILSGPYEYKLNRLPIIRMSGRVMNVGGKRVRYGLVRFMKDAVRMRNFWRSVAAEQLGYSPKAQWMATEGAVEGREDEIRNAHLSRDPLLIFNDEAVFGQNVQKVEPPQIQMALLQEANINTQDMKDITGIHDASLGIKSNETSGKAIMARQKEGDVASITFYDNGNAAVLEAGDVINQLIPQIYDATRIVRLIGEDETPKLMKINDPMNPKSPNLATGNYDVALSTGASYTTRRQEAAESMMAAIQVWPNLIQVAGDIVAKAQDWPGADKLAERLKKTIPPQFLSPEEQAEGGSVPQIDPAEVQKMQQELQKLQMENQLMKIEAKNMDEKLEIDRYNAETQRIRALSDHEVDGNKMEQDAIQRILDESDRQHAREMAEKALENAAQAAQAGPAAPEEV